MISGGKLGGVPGLSVGNLVNVFERSEKKLPSSVVM